MDRETLNKIVKSDSTYLYESEIWEMFNEEMNKAPEEMDTEIIDMCVDALERSAMTDSETDKKALARNEKLKFKLRKILLVAAVIALICCISATAFARKLHIDTPDSGVVKQKGSRIEIDLRNKEDVDKEEIVEALQNAGIDGVKLPEEIMSDAYKKFNMEFEDVNDGVNSISLEFENNSRKISGYIYMSIYSESYDYTIGRSHLESLYSHIEEVKVDDVTALIISEDGRTLILYAYGDLEYTISLDNCSIDAAKEIVKSLKEI